MVQTTRNVFKALIGLKSFLAIPVLLWGLQSASASTTSEKVLPKSILTESDYNEIVRKNERLQSDRTQDSFPEPLRPVTDYENFHYFLMSSQFAFDTREMKKRLVENLPARMKLVLLTIPGQEAEVRRTFSAWIPPERIILVTHPLANNGFWARDSFPIPVHVDPTLSVGLVASKYDREFSAHEDIAGAIGAVKRLRRYRHTFVGGNLLSDEAGRCFVVESRRLYGLRDRTLRESYGCKEVHRLKHVTGIGDVDEVIKILPRQRVLINRDEYRALFEGLGYQVFNLPQLSNYRTYANSVIVDDVVFMPEYGRPEDKIAAEVYSQFGYRVVPVPSETISTQGLGSVHCATMAYPKMDEEVLLRKLNLRRLH